MSTPGLVWTLDRTPSTRGRPPRASVNELTRVAIDILDAGGADALTMRALADRLHIALGAVYTYAPSREAVFDLACDAALADLPDWSRASDDWLGCAGAYLNSLRTLCEQHRWWPTLYPTRPIIGPNGLRLREQCLTMLAAAGFALADQEPTMMALTHLVIGTMLVENTWRSFQTHDRTEIETVEHYAVAARDAHPHYGAVMTGYIDITDPDAARDARWRAASEAVLTGLAARLDR